MEPEVENCLLAQSFKKMHAEPTEPKEVDEIKSIPKELRAEKISKLAVQEANRGRPGITYDFLRSVLQESRLLKEIASDWKQQYEILLEKSKKDAKRLAELSLYNDDASLIITQLQSQNDKLQHEIDILRERDDLMFAPEDWSELAHALQKLTVTDE